VGLLLRVEEGKEGQERRGKREERKGKMKGARKIHFKVKI